MDFQEMATDRLELVQIEKRHAKSFFDIMSRDEVTRYYGMSSLNELDEAESIIESFRQTFESGRGIRWGIVVKETGAFIGTVGLNNLNLKGKKAEIGFELHPSYWNKGYVSEAVKEVLAYCFGQLGLFRMGAVTFPENGASIALLQKLGFEKEGRLRAYLYQNDRSHDAFIFSLLADE
ncbi:MAG: GNAT family N-acetyltransferase [Planococcus sp. (in: firmicutes)]|nr:GNAT family N-acetyltransferase [Planococcus sp. (in: firmicutes)]